MNIDWDQCLDMLRHELSSEQFSMWLKPLKSHFDGESLHLYAGNRFILDWVRDEYFELISTTLRQVYGADAPALLLKVGVPPVAEMNRGVQAQFTADSSCNDSTNSDGIRPNLNRGLISQSSVEDSREISRLNANSFTSSYDANTENISTNLFGQNSENPRPEGYSEDYGQQSKALNGKVLSTAGDGNQVPSDRSSSDKSPIVPIPKLNNHKSNVKIDYKFDNFVEGKSNQLARAAAMQVAENPGKSYNPLFLYGSTGLGKTHLIHAVGNGIVDKNPNAKIVYMHSERFVQDMVKALQNNAIEDFKRFYRSVDALLIDDIQFFANKERSQEEFFHTFNALLEGNQQIILTSDRYPKEIDGVEDRLKSRFGWGLTVVIEPPELETRVAILMRKANENKIDLPSEVAFFMAKRIRSNVRELEGALNRVIANANFTGRPITIDFVRDALRDLLALQDKLVTIENIIKTVADYYQIKVADILSKRRTRSVARPRQMAMALAKEITNHSLPEIGNAFSGRDHTTVLHAVRKIEELKGLSHDVLEDYKNLIRTLSS